MRKKILLRTRYKKYNNSTYMYIVQFLINLFIIYSSKFKKNISNCCFYLLLHVNYIIKYSRYKGKIIQDVF